MHGLGDMPKILHGRLQHLQPPMDYILHMIKPCMAALGACE